MPQFQLFATEYGLRTLLDIVEADDLTQAVDLTLIRRERQTLELALSGVTIATISKSGHLVVKASDGRDAEATFDRLCQEAATEAEQERETSRVRVDRLSLNHRRTPED